MIELIKKIFIRLFTGLVNGSNHTNCISLSNQNCMTQPILINLHPHEYSQLFHHYPFAVKLDRCVGNFNTLNDLSNKVCVPNKKEDLNLRVFQNGYMNKWIEYKCKLNETKCNSNQWWNNDKCRYKYKKHHICKKEYVCYPSICICEKYLASIMDDSAIIWDEIIVSHDEEIKTIPTNFNKKV